MKGKEQWSKGEGERKDAFSQGIRRREKKETEKEKVGFTVEECRASSIDNE